MKKLLKVFASSVLALTLASGAALGTFAAETSGSSLASNLDVTEKYMANDYIKIVMNNTNGRYVFGTTGGNPESESDNNKKMLFGYPDIGTGTSFASFAIDDGRYIYGDRYNSQNSLVTPPSFFAERKANISQCKFGNITVTQTLTFVRNVSTERDDVLEVKYTVKNNDTVSHNIGTRIMFDTMLGSNDSAPFRIPGYGNVTTETEFEGSDIPQYWQAFDSLTNPTVISQGSFFRDRSSENNPDKVQFCNWRGIKATTWDYKTTLNKSNGDSAVAVVWNQKALEPGKTRIYTTYYGLSELTQDVTPPLALSIYGDTIVTSNSTNQTTGLPNYNNLVVTAYLENISNVDATDSYAFIELPRGMSLADGTRKINLDTIKKGESKQVSWNIKVDGSIAPENYNIQVTCGCNETAEKTVSRAVSIPVVLKNTSKVSSEYATIGDTIKIEASSTGGYGTHLYSILYKKPGENKWNKLVDESATKTASFKADTKGVYQVAVKVKDDNGSISDKIIKVNVYNKLVNKSAFASSVTSVGQNITVNGAVSGGSGSVQYSFYYKNATETKWTKKTDFTSSKKCVMTPSAAGKFYAKVVAKDTKTGKTATRVISVTVNEKLENTSTLSAATVAKGGSVTATCSAKGGIGGYKYSVVYKLSTDTKWTTAQDYTTSKTIVFTPPTDGTYDVCVKVMDKGNALDKKNFTLTVTGGVKNNSKVSSAHIMLTNTVKITANASQGSGGYTYSVLYKKNGTTKWGVLQKFSANKVVKFTPKAVGNYQICVIAKDSAGDIAKSYFPLKVSAKIENTSTVSSQNVSVGEKIKITNSAKGGLGGYTYGVLYKEPGASTWTVAENFKNSKTFSVTLKKSGKYEFCLKVKDKAGNVGKKYLDINVTKPLENTSTFSIDDQITVKASAEGGAGNYTYYIGYKKASDTQWIDIQKYTKINTAALMPEKNVLYDFCVKVKDAKGTIVKKYLKIAVSDN